MKLPGRPRLVLLSGAAVLALAGHARAQGHSATLHTTPQFSALPQTRTNPTRAQAPGSIHTGDWGVFNQLDGSPAGFGPVARYGAVRWAEDWSALRDRKLRNDPFDPLKFIRLNDPGSIYLTLSGESRLKNWFENRPFLGTQKPNDSGRMTVRNLLGADLHLGEHLRVYGELVNGDAAGWGGYGYSASYRTRLDVQQLFVEAKAKLLGAKTGVMFGRQEFLDAPNYVLYLRETPNLPLSYNGVRGYAVWPRIRFDAWDFVQTNITPPAMFADRPNWGTRLFGGLGSYALPDFTWLKQPGHVFLDVFYIGYLLGNGTNAIATATGTQTGSSRRDNVGTRLWGRAGPIEFSIGGIHQGGYFTPAKSAQSRNVDAYAINSFFGWRFAQLYGRPLLGLQADLFSGGDDRKRSGDVGTYATPFNPSSNYLDTTTYFGESNLISIAPTVEFTPSGTTLLRFRVPILWRDSTNDAVFSSGKAYAYRANFSGGFVGTVPQVNFGWRITHHLTWSHDLARAFVSRSLARAGASDGTYYLSTLSFRF
ncbi:alginate export family protein [Acetobacteraceae bacterium KSS8]|uniref:Alginate export family protein n=1 Tax=Endosaccharibacter trunci TaxID=2812733 RepID=A0ABT1WD35_9PROT|nr:alginate export family protein [Acetobacteraceae bacterium KSS8]